MNEQSGRRFVLHEHFAKHHHFDLRPEKEWVLVNWAVPKGLPEQSGVRRLAIQVEDHPLHRIWGDNPGGRNGAGEVKIADSGTYETLLWTPDRIEVIFGGTRISGKYTIIRFRNAGDKEWLILKVKQG